MTEKVKKLNITRATGYLYYLRGAPLEVWRSPMKRGSEPTEKAELIATTGVERQPGWLYYLDKQGDLARTPQQRGGSSNKAR